MTIEQAQTLYPLSFAQQRVWFIQQQYPNDSLYNRTTVMRLRGELEADLLESSLDAILYRHAILRAIFTDRQGVPHQQIQPHERFLLQKLDFSQQEVPQESAIWFVQQETKRPFDLHHAPLFRIYLLKLHTDEHLLVIIIHHILLDAWSIELVLAELKQRYTALKEGKAADVTPDFAYLDVCMNQSLENSSAFDRDKQFWTQNLEGELPPLQFPWDFTRELQADNRAGAYTLELSKELTDGLKALSRRERVTLFMLLFSAFQVLLSRYTNQEDIITGVPVTGRTSVETQQTVGLFINTLPIRTRIPKEYTFAQLLQEVRRDLLSAFNHQDLPIERLTHSVYRSNSHPLYCVLFNMHNVPMARDETDHWMEEVPFDDGLALFNIQLLAEEKRGELYLSLKYKTSLLKAESIQGFAQAYETILQSLLNDIHQSVARIPLMSDGTMHRILVEWNQTEQPYPRENTLQQLFQDVVNRAPLAVAIEHATGSMTYSELNSQSDELAAILLKMKTGCAPIGIAMERSTDWIIAMLAVIKAGGAYVPIGIDLPKERLEHIVKDTGMSLILTKRRYSDRLTCTCKRYFLDDESVREADEEELPVEGNATDLAYIMYTSGSTGTPKGVAITHRAVARLVINTNYAVLDEHQTILQFSILSFDAATFEIWGSLLNGAKLVIPDPEANLLDVLGETIRKYTVTTLFMTTELFHFMVSKNISDLAPLKQLLVGGDILDPICAERFVQQVHACKLINAYGPTENTTFTTYFPIHTDLDFSRSVPIGKPISNTRVFILDDNRHPVPPGVIGELCIAGDGLAAGYLNAHEQHEQRFLFANLPGIPNERLYRTGDLARYLPDGNIEFIGRNDRQLKIRGFRVEPAEIEHVLRQYPNVQSAVIRTLQSDTEGKRLFAYITEHQKKATNIQGLTLHLLNTLPEYMIPERIHIVPEIPLTASGKVNLGALPYIEMPDIEPVPYVAPRTEIERRMAALWGRLFGIERVSVTDDFFMIGGHSLLALRLLADIETEFGIKLSVSNLLSTRTCEKLALFVQESSMHNGFSIIHLSSRGTKPPLFFVHGVNGNVLAYWKLAQQLKSDRPIYGLCWGGEQKKSLMSFEEIAKHQMEQLIRFLPKGPYLLCGYSLGGLLAYEIARQLIASGRSVVFLALLDTTPAIRKISFPKQVQRHFLHMRQLPRRERLSYLYKRITNMMRIVPNRLRLFLSARLQAPVVSLPLEKRNRLSQQLYNPAQYSGPMLIIRAKERNPYRIYEDEYYGWGRYVTGRLETCEVPGKHETLLQEPHVGEVAIQLQKYLDLL